MFGASLKTTLLFWWLNVFAHGDTGIRTKHSNLKAKGVLKPALGTPVPQWLSRSYLWGWACLGWSWGHRGPLLPWCFSRVSLAGSVAWMLPIERRVREHGIPPCGLPSAWLLKALEILQGTPPSSEDMSCRQQHRPTSPLQSFLARTDWSQISLQIIPEKCVLSRKLQGIML